MKLFIFYIVFLSNQLFSQDLLSSNSDCPFLTSSLKDDQDYFAEIHEYFKAISNTPECSQSGKDGMQTVTELKSIMNTDEAKCYTKNLFQTKLRDSALTNTEKGIEISSSSPYSECNTSSISRLIGQVTSKDKTLKCISDLFQNNTDECKAVKISQSVQDKLSKGMGDLQKIVSSNMTINGKCGTKAQENLNVVMSTAKSISAFLPWGGVAGIGIDLVNVAVDKYFSYNTQEVTTTMDALLDSDSYEHDACLYFSLQQRLYCSENALQSIPIDPKCERNNTDNGLVKLLENVHDIKNATSVVAGSTENTQSFNVEDTSYLEASIDDLVKYAKASEQEIYNRIKSLPKVHQAKEKKKIDYFFKLLDIYQLSNRETKEGLAVGEKALGELMPLLYSSDPSLRIDFQQIVLSSSPGLKMDVIKQRGLISALKNFESGNVDDSRKIAKLSKYKNILNMTAQNELKNYLEHRFEEFKKHVAQLLKINNSLASDLEGEGMLRDIVRHCVLLQEVYDPQIEGKIPDQCARINCGKENRLGWFVPRAGQNKVAQFKKLFCEKRSSYKIIENDYIKELKDTSGPKICGSKISEFLE